LVIGDWDREIGALEKAVACYPNPSVNEIHSRTGSPWCVLVSTIISLRTRDAVTLSASERLLAAAPDPQALMDIGIQGVSEMIYPAGFYRTKAENLVKISRILLEKHAGAVPSVLEDLVTLPGVGLKTANLVLSTGFGIPAICVDIHVHRIANRRGWISSKTPDESEKLLRSILPVKWWIEINRILVRFGQTVCTPVSPRCSSCPVSVGCPGNGVMSRR
jgi:endonuclease-3